MRLTENINGEIVIPKKNVVNGDLNPFFNKLGQLENIEDELSIDLITLFKVLRDGFWHKSFYFGTYDYYGLDEWDIYLDANVKAIRVINKQNRHSQGLFALTDYGKIWALTKE